MAEINIRVNAIAPPNFEVDARWVQEIATADDRAVLGKWALYYTLLDQNLLPKDDLEKAQKIYDRLDFERLYRDGEFEKGEHLSGPSKYDLAVDIFKFSRDSETIINGAYSREALVRVIAGFEEQRHSDEYERLTDTQKEAMMTLMNILYLKLKEVEQLEPSEL